MKAYYHLPGLFEFYELYSLFLPLYAQHREYFYDWCAIGSIYGAPQDCLWNGGRACMGDEKPEKVLKLLEEYGISAELTFSNSLLTEAHLSDRKCNRLCRIFETAGAEYDRQREEKTGDAITAEDGIIVKNRITEEDEVIVKDKRTVKNGIIVYSELLLDYLQQNYPGFYFASSTTKVLTDFDEFKAETDREEFSYVVPDFRLNKSFDRLNILTEKQKGKVEFLCNEACNPGCTDRKVCYENVSRKNLDEDVPDFACSANAGGTGYTFSKAMESREFISPEMILEEYMPRGFYHFKIEGRGLGSAVVLEMLLYYMVKPECRIKVRECIYLDNMLDLF